jgi:hypothetical protein
MLSMVTTRAARWLRPVPRSGRKLKTSHSFASLQMVMTAPTLPTRQLLGISSVPPTLKHHHSPLGHGWDLVDGRCRPIRHTQSALPIHLRAPGQADGEEDESEEDEGDDGVPRSRVYSSESDGPEFSDSD